MINLKKTATVLLCLCIFLATANVIILWKSENKAKQQPKGEVFEITNFKVCDVLAVTIENNTTKFGIMQNNAKIEVISENAENIGYDLSQLRAFIYSVSHLNGSRKITNKAEFENYNYGSPVSVATIITRSGNFEFCLLMENPIDSNYYLYSKKDDAIYLIPKEEGELLLRSEKDFQTHSVFPTYSAKTMDMVEGISFDYNDQKHEDFTITARNGIFYMTKPVETRLSSANIFSQIFTFTNALYGDNILSEQEAASYDMSNYSLKITISDTKNVYSALLLELEDGSYLMQNAQGGPICKINDDNLAMLKLDPIDLLSGKIYNFSSGIIKTIEAQGKGFYVLLNCTAETADGIISKNGTEDEVHLSGNLWKEYCLSIGSVKIESQLDNESSRLDAYPATMTLKFTENNDNITEIVFTEKNQKIYVSVNDKCNFTTNFEHYNQVVNAIKSL